LEAAKLVAPNVVDVIDSGGLFSGNAIGPSRSVMMRLTTNFQHWMRPFIQFSMILIRTNLIR